jgi:hypothetical protein
MQDDREFAARADPKFQQHFLVSAEKLAELIAAAGIRPTDDVLEVGAGIGTVANVGHGDALDIIRSFSFDVLIGNLPNSVTESLLKLTPGCRSGRLSWL